MNEMGNLPFPYSHVSDDTWLCRQLEGQSLHRRRRAGCWFVVYCTLVVRLSMSAGVLFRMPQQDTCVVGVSCLSVLRMGRGERLETRRKWRVYCTYWLHHPDASRGVGRRRRRRKGGGGGLASGWHIGNVSALLIRESMT